MQAVILAAGEGTRMRPLTANLPKPMLPVADRPLVAHTADAAVAAGASELVFVVGYEAGALRNHFGESYRGCPVRFAVQEERRGTAHAVLAASEHIDGDFVVLNGDDLYDAASIGRLFEHCPAVGAHTVADPSPYGVFSLDGDRVTGIVEKPKNPPTNQVNVGAYHFPAAARDELDVPVSERGEHELTDVLARVLEEYEVRIVPVDRWLGVGRPWELLAANEWKLGELTRRLDGDVSGRADLRGDVVVEAGARIEPGAVIDGPCLVRADASVGPNAHVRGATLLCEGVEVGHAVEIKNSVVMAEAAVPHLSYVGDSVLGRRVNLGAGTQVANLRHDDEPIEQTVAGERVSTGRRKFGVVAGDDVKTGINTTIYPGVTLSSGIQTDPAETVSRDR